MFCNRKKGSGFRVQGCGFRVVGSGLRVQGCGGGFAANIYGAMPEGLRVAVFPYRHLERIREIFLADGEMVYVRKSVAPASARRHFPITACMLISVVQ